MHKIREKISLLLTGMAYLAFHLRYASGRPVDSAVATGKQMLTTSPAALGLTILLVFFLQRMAGERLPWDRVLRIFFTIGIIVGFLYGLNDYWLRG